MLFPSFPPVQDGRALVELVQAGLDVGDGLGGGQLHLLAGGQVLDGGHAGLNFVLPQEDDVGDVEFVGVGCLLYTSDAADDS